MLTLSAVAGDAVGDAASPFTMDHLAAGDANLALGWLWTFLGVLSGAAIGLGFLEPDFLGGYASPRRRLVRLGHISFFGLGAINILFALSIRAMDVPAIPGLLQLASPGLIVGALTMPLACGLVAWRQSLHPIFLIPVLPLIGSTAMIAWEAISPTA